MKLLNRLKKGDKIISIENIGMMLTKNKEYIILENNKYDHIEMSLNNRESGRIDYSNFFDYFKLPIPILNKSIKVL